MTTRQNFTREAGDQFFMAFTKRSGSPHAHVIVGCRRASGESFVLASIGKGFKDSKWFPCLDNIGLAFEVRPAETQGHGEFRDDEKQRHIDYAAFAISYQQYLDFLNLLQSLHRGLEAYVPDGANANSLRAGRTNTQFYPEASDSEKARAAPLIARHQTLSLMNNCRHYSLDVLRHVIADKAAEAYFPPAFFCNLVHKATIKNGSFAQPVVILPLPPSQTDKRLSPARFKALNRMHQQLYFLSRKAAGSQNALAQFESLSALYQQQHQPECDTLEGLVRLLKDWRELPETKAAQRFGYCFWRKSNSLRMVDSISKLARAPGAAFKH